MFFFFMVIKMQQGTFFSLSLYSSSYHRPTPSLPAAPVDPSAAAATTVRSSLKSPPAPPPAPPHAYSPPLTCSECESTIGGRLRGREVGVRKHPGVFKGLLQSYF